MTLTGTPGTLVPVDYLIEGGGADGKARWALTDDAYIGAGGSVEVVVEAVEPGPTEAAPGELDTIITPVDGWDSVTNAAQASPGQARETDDALRLRRQASLQVPGSTSARAIRAALLELDVVLAATVLENDSNATVSVEGTTLAPHALRAVLWTGAVAPALSDDQLTAITLALHESVSAGIRTEGADVSATVEGEGLVDRTIRWDWASPVDVDVGLTLTLAEGYVLADVEPRATELVEDYFGALTVGSAVRLLALYATLYTVEGVEAATITLDGAGADVEPTLTQIARLGTLTVSAA